MRRVTADDADALAAICLATGADGLDAAGIYGDDRLLADVYALPYLYGPGRFGLVWDDGNGATGYVLGTDDTAAFQEWFSDLWWPSLAARTARTDADANLLASVGEPGCGLIDRLDEFPAHLHIDLLPVVQRRGIGRMLIEAAITLLRERASPGVHLVASRTNAGACAFYPRVGFAEMAKDDHSVTFARSLR